MKFVFIAKHRSIWPVAWLCNAMGVSRSGFHAWLNRSPSARSLSDETVGQQVKASFLASDRTYGARRVWRSGFHAWLNRTPSARSRSDEALGRRVRASFVASDRTYGARRVWHDMLAEGFACGLHRIERLMQLQALRARPRRRHLPKMKAIVRCRV